MHNEEDKEEASRVKEEKVPFSSEVSAKSNQLILRKIHYSSHSSDNMEVKNGL